MTSDLPMVAWSAVLAATDEEQPCPRTWTARGEERRGRIAGRSGSVLWAGRAVRLICRLPHVIKSSPYLEFLCSEFGCQYRISGDQMDFTPRSAFGLWKLLHF